MLVHELQPTSKPQHDLAYLKNGRCQIMSNRASKNTRPATVHRSMLNAHSSSDKEALCTQRHEDDANLFTDQGRARDWWLEEQRREWMCSDTPSEPRQHEQPVQLHSMLLHNTSS